MNSRCATCGKTKPVEEFTTDGRVYKTCERCRIYSRDYKRAGKSQTNIHQRALESMGADLKSHEWARIPLI